MVVITLFLFLYHPAYHPVYKTRLAATALSMVRDFLPVHKSTAFEGQVTYVAWGNLNLVRQDDSQLVVEDSTGYFVISPSEGSQFESYHYLFHFAKIRGHLHLTMINFQGQPGQMSADKVVNAFLQDVSEVTTRHMESFKAPDVWASPLYMASMKHIFNQLYSWNKKSGFSLQRTYILTYPTEGDPNMIQLLKSKFGRTDEVIECYMPILVKNSHTVRTVFHADLYLSKYHGRYLIDYIAVV